MKRAIRPLVLLVVIVACGQENAPQPPTEPGVVASFALDAGGGTIRHGRLTLVVPEGALSSPTTITVTELESAPWGVVGPAYELGPEGLEFAVPATLSISHDGLEMPPGTEPERLRVALLDGQRWRILPGRESFEADLAAAAPLEHFSTYGLVPVAAEDEGYGRRLAVNGIVVDTTQDVFARLRVSPTIVQLSLSGGDATPVDVTLSGLPTDADQYVYLGSYRESRVVSPSAGGRVTLTTVLDEPKVLWVQPMAGTYVIGGPTDECAAIGGIRVGTTCTLTAPVVGSLEIVGLDQVLDCAGYSITQTPANAGYGVGIAVGSPWGGIGTDPPVNVTVRNCVVGAAGGDFAVGLQGFGIEGLTVEDCTLAENASGIALGPGTGGRALRNTLTGGIWRSFGPRRRAQPVGT